MSESNEMMKLLIIFLLVMVFALGTAHAKQYEVAPAGTKACTTAAGITPGGTISLAIWFTGVPDDHAPVGPDPQQAGSAWIS